MKLHATPFDGRSFLEVARALVDSQANEAEIRTAIGRCYYAVFLAHAEPIAKRLKIDPHDLKHHEWRDGLNHQHGLINEIAAAFGDRRLQGYAERLYQWRIAADYRPTNPAQSRQAGGQSYFMSDAEASNLIQLAERVFTITGV